MVERLVLGTRGSKLARWQSDHIADVLRARHGVEVEVRVFSTRGDRILDKPLPEIGGKGLFTAELEEALRSGEIDLAVHSLKDLPTEEPEGLAVVAVPRRADSRDALCLPDAAAGSLASLPAGAVVGTSSLRRRAQLQRLRPDLRVADVRGNVDTRLRKLDEGQYGALLLACAGLDRLGLGDRIAERLDRPWLGAAGQGALGVQSRVDDDGVRPLLAALDDKPARLEVTAERSVLAILGGGCSLPLGVSAEVSGDRLTLSAVLMDPEGDTEIRAERKGEATQQGARRLGKILCRDLMDRGAQALLDAAPP